MHTRFFLINRSQHAMQNHFFQCKRFASATHIVSFHIGNIPYASGIAIPFGPGLENLIRIRLHFVRGMKNPAGIGFRFTRGIENPAGLRFVFTRWIKNRIGIGFIRPPAWPFVGRIQYAPTRATWKMAIFFPFDHCRGRLWGVCNTPLPYRAKIHRGFGSFLFGESKIESELDSFGLWRGRL